MKYCPTLVWNSAQHWHEILRRYWHKTLAQQLSQHWYEILLQYCPNIGTKYYTNIGVKYCLNIGMKHCSNIGMKYCPNVGTKYCADIGVKYRIKFILQFLTIKFPVATRNLINRKKIIHTSKWKLQNIKYNKFKMRLTEQTLRSTDLLVRKVIDIYSTSLSTGLFFSELNYRPLKSENGKLKEKSLIEREVLSPFFLFALEGSE